MSDQQSLASTSRPGSPVHPLPDFSNARPYRFAWDAASHRQGPASVSGASEGRGDYFAYKPMLGNFNLSSTSLALGAIPSDWSASKYGFNAISNLVNSPHKKSAPPKAHAPVPPIIPSQLPRVRRKDFDPYLKSITSEYDRFEKSVHLGQEGQLEMSTARLAQMDADPLSSPPTPRAGHFGNLPPLETVPQVFFETKFDLSDQKTFAVVTEQHDSDGEIRDPASLSHSLPLLEKLSHYADTIELHLIREISLRSSSFFAALTNLNELQTESAQCLERIQKLRSSLKEVDEQKAKKGLELVRLERKAKNFDKVQDGVRMMHNVVELLGAAKSLTSGAEWDAALNIIDGLQGLWSPEPAKVEAKATETQGANNRGKVSRRNSKLPSVPEQIIEEGIEPTERSDKERPLDLPLSLLSAFSRLPEHLQLLSHDIANSLTSELLTVLKSDLLAIINEALPHDGEKSGDGRINGDDSREERMISLGDRLRPLARGLKRTKRLKESMAKWRDMVMAEIKSSTKMLLPSSEELELEEQVASTKSSSDKAATLRNQLRDMTHEEFLALLKSLYGVQLRVIQELQTQHNIFFEILQSLSTPNERDEYSILQDDLSDMLFSATELAHSRASKILGIRSDKHASLSLPEFLSVFNESWEFIIKTETICHKMVIGLRGTAISQAKSFLQAMHQRRISDSAKYVEEEQWSAAEVPPKAQATVNLIVESAVRDSPELLVSEEKPASPETQQENGQTSKTNSKNLLIEDRKYYAVSATLQMLELLVDYLKVITNVSLLTTDAVGRVIEFLKAFNSRTCQVVLGAGAMRSAGLKNITAKHLALASQSLSIVTALIPYVRESFRRHLNPKQAVMLVEFDKLKRDYQEHQQEIHAKLIAIMGDRLNAHCKSLQVVDWSVSRDGVNDYMTVLVKETVTLHKVLSRYLQESVLEQIMSQVFATINHRLTEEYGKIDIANQDAKDRMLRDTHYLKQQFSGLKNTHASFGMLEAVVAEKQIPGAKPPPVASRQPTTPAPISTIDLNGQAKAHASQSNIASTMESANVRLKGIFRRSSTMLASEPKSPVAPPSPMQERRTSGMFPEKSISEEPTNTLEVPESISPPPAPAKDDGYTTLDVPTSAPNSRPSSPVDRPKSPRVLPIPVPTLNADGDIVDGSVIEDSELLNLPPTPSAIDEIMEASLNGKARPNGTQ